MTVSEMAAILRGEVKFYDSPEDVQSKLNEIADELERLSAERDAAVADLAVEKDCRFCKYCGKSIRPGIYCDREDCHYGEYDKWEWRGVQHD